MHVRLRPLGSLPDGRSHDTERSLGGTAVSEQACRNLSPAKDLCFFIDKRTRGVYLCSFTDPVSWGLWTAFAQAHLSNLYHFETYFLGTAEFYGVVWKGKRGDGLAANIPWKEFFILSLYQVAQSFSPDGQLLCLIKFAYYKNGNINSLISSTTLLCYNQYTTLHS
jgi:hypothetical protein